MISTFRYSFNFGGKYVASRLKVVLPYVCGGFAKLSPSRNWLSYSTGVINCKTSFLLSNNINWTGARSFATKTYPAQQPLMELPPVNAWSADQAEVDDLRNCVEDIHVNHIDAKSVLDMLRVRLGFTSNRIDGNSFSQVDVIDFIKTGVSVQGRLIREHQEIDSHDRALQMVHRIGKDPTAAFRVGINFVKELHAVCAPARRVNSDDCEPGVLKTKQNCAISRIGGKPILRNFVEPEQACQQLCELLQWANDHASTLPILPFVTIFHYNFVRIAPFSEHNGRVARLLVTLFMLRRAYPPMIIEPDDRKHYKDALAHADQTGDLVPLTKLFGRSIINTYQELIRLQGPLVD